MIGQIIGELFAQVTGPICAMAAAWAALSLGLLMLISRQARRN
jgi:hypothetical protein